MGWDGAYDWKGIGDVKADVRASIARSGGKVLGEAGSAEWWYVLETAAGERHLLLTLIEKHGTCWMKKDMGEAMFPYYYKCPDRLLALVGDPKDDLSTQWRAWRLAKIAAEKRVWAPGDLFYLFSDPSKPHHVVSIHGRGFIAADAAGRRWKVKPADMAPADALPPGSLEFYETIKANEAARSSAPAPAQGDA